MDRNAAEGRPYGLYGNSFARASESAIRRATVPIDPPTVTNLICMAALGGGHGVYKLEQIVDSFFTIYTSFKAAIIESHRLKPGSACIIHTGNWGCGAFGGNRALMSLLQLLGAWMAGVDELVYHTFDKIGTDGYKAGMEKLNELVQKAATGSLEPQLPATNKSEDPAEANNESDVESGHTTAKPASTPVKSEVTGATTAPIQALLAAIEVRLFDCKLYCG